MELSMKTWEKYELFLHPDTGFFFSWPLRMTDVHL